jgi:hypothetical protein
MNETQRTNVEETENKVTCIEFLCLNGFEKLQVFETR